MILRPPSILYIQLIKYMIALWFVNEHPQQAYILLIIFSPSTIVYSSNETHYLSAKNPQEPRPLTSINEAPTLALSIVVPAYNERERLGTMVDEAMEYLTQIPKPTSASSSDGAVTNGHANKADDVDMTMKVKVKVNVDVKERLASRYADGVEFIIVDDGSKDDTTQIALEIAQQWDKKIGQMGDIGFEIDVRIVKLEVNRGKGGSVRHVSMRTGSWRLFAVPDYQQQSLDTNRVCRNLLIPFFFFFLVINRVFYFHAGNGFYS